MADVVTKVTFKKGTLKIDTAGDTTPGTEVEQISAPITLDIGMTLEEIRVWFERFPIGHNLENDSFELSTLLADSTLTGLALAFPGLSAGAWGDEETPTTKSVLLSVPFASGALLNFLAPYCVVSSNGSVEIGRQAHQFPIKFTAFKGDASVAPLTISVTGP